MSPGHAFIDAVARWAARNPNVLAAILVGSYARGCERPDSDVDVVLACRDPGALLTSPRWLAEFGDVQGVAWKPFRTLTTLEVAYQGGFYAELGVAHSEWGLDDDDDEVRRICSRGKRVLYDSRRSVP